MSLPSAFGSIVELASQLHSGVISTSELLECYANRIASLNETCKAYISLDIDRARVLAEQTHPGPGDNPLKGIPYACKDLFMLKASPPPGARGYWLTISRKMTPT